MRRIDLLGHAMRRHLISNSPASDRDAALALRLLLSDTLGDSRLAGQLRSEFVIDERPEQLALGLAHELWKIDRQL